MRESGDREHCSGPYVTLMELSSWAKQRDKVNMTSGWAGPNSLALAWTRCIFSVTHEADTVVVDHLVSLL